MVEVYVLMIPKNLLSSGVFSRMAAYMDIKEIPFVGQEVAYVFSRIVIVNLS